MSVVLAPLANHGTPLANHGMAVYLFLVDFAGHGVLNKDVTVWQDGALVL